MFGRHICASLVSVALIVVPAERAMASDAAKILGGAILGGIILNEVNKNKQRRTTTTRSRSSGISAAQREETRNVQNALNYFGYNVGSADGVAGRKTRAGVARYQADMGFNSDGTLEPYERDFLLSSHQRAQTSSHVAPYAGIMATQGTPGLLRTYRNEQLGIATPQQTPQPVPVPASTQPAPVPMPAPQQVTRTEPAALPDFTIGEMARSMSEHCNEVGVLTAANGGLTGATGLSDREFALNEQFCLARTHAMSEATAITATIANMTEAQVESQCQGLKQVMAEQVAGIEGKDPLAVEGEVGRFLQGTGRPMDQLISAGKVCLGVGYRIDDADMALGSAVLLAGAGVMPYGEMVSHHLREGFGAPKAPAETSQMWMDMAMDAVADGATPMSGQSAERLAVLRAASAATGAPRAELPVFTTGD